MADGTIKQNNYLSKPVGVGLDGKVHTATWRSLGMQKPSQLDNDSIYLTSDLGTGVQFFQPSIIRPLDSVTVPKNDCNFPEYGSSKFQQWCSENNASKYFAMRPLVQPDEYNGWLRQLFAKISTNPQASSMVNSAKWSSVFCENSKQAIMKSIMTTIAIAVSKMPAMHHNGSWVVEQFHYTDADMYETIDAQGNKLYTILFNLYNPLRSVGTQVEARVRMVNDTSVSVLYMSFVNTLDWKSDGTKIDGIEGFNFSTQSGQNPQITVSESIGQNGSLVPTPVEWSYGNTLLKNEFNKYGFYQDPNSKLYDPYNLSGSNAEGNVRIEAEVPENLKKSIKQYTQNERSYLMGCSTVGYNGFMSQYANKEKLAPSDGVPRNVYDNPSVIYNLPLSLERDGPYGLKQVTKNVSYKPTLNPVDYVVT